MWSTTVTGIAMPCRRHSSQSGWSCNNFLLSRLHREPYPLVAAVCISSGCILLCFSQYFFPGATSSAQPGCLQGTFGFIGMSGTFFFCPSFTVYVCPTEDLDPQLLLHPLDRVHSHILSSALLYFNHSSLSAFMSRGKLRAALVANYFRVNSDRNSSFCSHVAHNQYFKPFILFKRAFYTMTFQRLPYILHTGFLISVSYSCFLFAGMAVSQEPGHWCHRVPKYIDELGKIKQINSSQKDFLALTFEENLNITEQRPSFLCNIYNTFLITPVTNL